MRFRNEELIRLDKLVPKEENLRNRRSDAAFEKLKASIKRRGILVEIIVSPLDEEKYLIEDGNTRVCLPPMFGQKQGSS